MTLPLSQRPSPADGPPATWQPDVLVVPAGGTNTDLASVSAGLLAAHWAVSVVDFNTLAGKEVQRLSGTWQRRGVVGPSRIGPEVRRLRQIDRSRGYQTAWQSANGPVDVQCCYPMYRSDHPFDWEAPFDDALPFPDYDRFDSLPVLAENWRKGKWLYPVMTGLGCPFGCRYCAARRRNPAFRSAAHCAGELASAKRRWKIRRFVVVDDCFNVSPSHVRRFAESIAPLGLEWMAGNGLRADRFDRETGRLMRRSGCKWVAFGVETVHDRLLKRIEKGETFAQIDRAVSEALKIFEFVNVFLILGLPGATEASDRQSIAWAKSKGAHIHVSFYTPPTAAHTIEHVFDSPEDRPLSSAYARDRQLALYRWARS